MNENLKRNFIDIEPYVAGEQPKKADFIKLNANENPYPPSPKCKEALESLEYGKLRKYPDASGRILREVLGKYYGFSEDEVFVGNGSDDVLALSFRAFFNSGKKILFPDITYSFYPVWCKLMNIPFETVNVNDKFEINPEMYSDCGGVVIPNPNAPTSLSMGEKEIRKVIENNKDSIVIIDEAYVDFSEYTAIDLVHEYDNLLVTQTMSKSRSLAGMRIGMAFGQKHLISVLSSVRDSFNSYPLDTAAQALAIASVEDDEYFKNTVQKIKNTRDENIEKLKSLGFTVLRSSTNFIFCTHEKYKAKDIMEYLKTKDIYVRYFNKTRIDNYLRITVGTDDEMEMLINALEGLIK